MYFRKSFNSFHFDLIADVKSERIKEKYKKILISNHHLFLIFSAMRILLAKSPRPWFVDESKDDGYTGMII